MAGSAIGEQHGGEIVSFHATADEAEREGLRLLREREAQEEREAAQRSKDRRYTVNKQKASPTSERVLRKTIRMTPGNKERES